MAIAFRRLCSAWAVYMLVNTFADPQAERLLALQIPSLSVHQKIFDPVVDAVVVCLFRRSCSAWAFALLLKTRTKEPQFVLVVDHTSYFVAHHTVFDPEVDAVAILFRRWCSASAWDFVGKPLPHWSQT